jgi:hypothetical protein
MDGEHVNWSYQLVKWTLTMDGEHVNWSYQLVKWRAGRKTVVLVEGSWQQAKKLEAGLPRGAWRKCDHGLTIRNTI